MAEEATYLLLAAMSLLHSNSGRSNLTNGVLSALCLWYAIPIYPLHLFILYLLSFTRVSARTTHYNIFLSWEWGSHLFLVDLLWLRKLSTNTLFVIAMRNYRIMECWYEDLLQGDKVLSKEEWLLAIWQKWAVVLMWTSRDLVVIGMMRQNPGLLLGLFVRRAMASNCYLIWLLFMIGKAWRIINFKIVAVLMIWEFIMGICEVPWQGHLKKLLKVFNIM